ncbi:MAG TPA: glycosyltransferase [Gaiellaceae bacterium]|nr:glycosyltransferase [Gaiellaceae bacterium]
MPADDAPPRVTVLMGVYDGEAYLAEAIRSILEQTFADFEFLIVDDGSTDSSRQIVESFPDPRIRLLVRPNRGLAASLREGIELARGEYVARQDADDVSLPSRLERQVALLDSDPEVGLVGSNYVHIDLQGRPVGGTKLFTHEDDLKVAQIVSNQFGHGSVMIRKRVLDVVGSYDPGVYTEDYDLFARIGHAAKTVNIGEPLYLWRRNPVGTTFSNRPHQLEQSFVIRDREFRRLLERRDDYRVFSSFHPLSFHSGALDYLVKKSNLLRGLAYLYRLDGEQGAALRMQLAATALAPWRRVNYACLWRLLVVPSGDPPWEYEAV